ncbi:histidine phosphatase family protein [Bacillus sp. RO3]|nr:histidine phosphatase family protein [Bacillus sp. RO3]
MEISLIRHGKSLCNDNTPIPYSTFKEWVEEYDNAGVFEEETYPSKSIEKVSSSHLVFTSHLKRAVHSASILSPTITPEIDATFREVELPTLVKVHEKILLPPTVWLVIVRMIWFLGYSKGCESSKHAKERAVRATEQLSEAARKHHHIVLVGHGFFNKMIAKELKRNGWKNRKMSTKHWVCHTFSMSNE